MIKDIIGMVFIVIGILFVVTAVFGIYRFKYVLNRMHAAAICDTLGVFCVLVGCMIFWGLSFATLKCLLILIFLWLAGPVSSHLIMRLELTTNETMREELEEESK